MPTLRRRCAAREGRRSPGQALVQLGVSAAIVEEALRAAHARVGIEVTSWASADASQLSGSAQSTGSEHGLAASAHVGTDPDVCAADA